MTNQSYKTTTRKIYAYKYIAYFHMFSPILIPFFTQWAKLSIFQFMLLEAWCMLCMFIFEIPSGAVADYLGRKNTMITGLTIQAMGFIIYVSFPNFYVYMLGEAVLALGFSLISGTEEAFIYDTLKNYDKESDSKIVFGRAESFGLAGIMTAAPLGSLLAHKAGLSKPLFFMFVPIGIAILILLTMKEPLVKGKQKEKSSYIKIIKGGVSIFYKNSTLKILAMDMVFITTMGFLMIWLYQLMLEEAGVELLFYGFVNTLMVVFEIILLNTYGKLEKLLKSKKRLLFLSSLLIGIMFIVGGITRFIPIVVMVILVVGGFSLTRKVLMMSYMNKFIPSEERATVISSSTMFISFTKMVFFPLVGLVTEKISLSVVLIALGVITIIFSFISRVEEKHLVD